MTVDRFHYERHAAALIEKAQAAQERGETMFTLSNRNPNRCLLTRLGLCVCNGDWRLNHPLANVLVLPRAVLFTT